jgi:hypothetical protein
MSTLHFPIHKNKASTVSLIAGLFSFFPLAYIAALSRLPSDLGLGADFHTVAGDISAVILIFLPTLLAVLVTCISAGVVALTQIDKSEEDGGQSAIAGLALGCLGLAVIIFYLF